MRQTLLRALVIVLASATLGLVTNAVRWDADRKATPRRLPFITPPLAPVQDADKIPLREAKQVWDTGAAFFLDARAPADYEAGHISGALSLPVEEFDKSFPTVAPMLAPDSVIVVYCDGIQCDLSHHLQKELRGRGFTNVRLIVNGWTEWRQAGYPTKTGPQP